jgi:hypothetical protein
MNKNQNNPYEIVDPNEILQDLMDPAKKVKSEFTKESQQFTKTQTDELIETVSKYYNVPQHIALIGIISTLQRGGTSRNKKSNVKVRFAQTTFESKIINAYIVKANKNFTPRQFARYFADQIFDIARAHDLDGNCFVYISRNIPELITDNPEERFWASDFQVDNPNCPQNIRNALNMRYNAKFRGIIKKEANKVTPEKK